jgi:hypothetical protein
LTCADGWHIIVGVAQGEFVPQDMIDFGLGVDDELDHLWYSGIKFEQN